MLRVNILDIKLSLRSSCEVKASGEKVEGNKRVVGNIRK